MFVAPSSNSDNFKNVMLEKNFVITQKPTRGLKREIANRSTTDPNWSQQISEETMTELS